MKLETDKQLVRDNLSSRGPKNVRYFMDGLVVPSSDYIPIYVYNCVIFRARVSTWKTIIGDTVFSAFLKFCSLISSLSSTFFVYKDMHIIYHFKAFEKGFQVNVNASRNISNTFQSTLKNSGDINWSIFVRISEKGANLRPPVPVLGGLHTNQQALSCLWS